MPRNPSADPSARSADLRRSDRLSRPLQALMVCVGLSVFTVGCATGNQSTTSGPGAGDGGKDAAGDTTSGFEVGFDTGLGEAGDASPDDTSGDGGTGCGAVEICANGLDDDCNGKVDEGCSCRPGDVKSCYRGSAKTRSVGTCADGKMTCVGATEFGTWGPCTGDVLPGEELCDPAGADENCNGTSNEGCECSDGSPPVSCGSSVGACKPGTQRCVGGKLGPCEGAIGPSAEVCDGIDNNCDGAVDESLSEGCGSSVGACKPGTRSCKDAKWTECLGGVVASPEKCNGVDDDCNGKVDDGIVEACGSSVGACKPGNRICKDGVFGACEGEVGPKLETCNNIDDDCNGKIDDGLTRGCGKNVGICKPGTETCAAGTWGSCLGGVPAGTEICEGKTDEDCDGVIDNGCGCTNGDTRACGTNVGICKPGTQTCVGGLWSTECKGATLPGAELCDGLDNNCDGRVDEGCLCKNGDTRPCGSSVGSCRPGAETCDLSGKWGTCLGAIGPVPEVCNGQDDNCNGAVDEGGICPKFPPTVVCPGSLSTTVGTAVSLSATGSDPDGGPVTFAWTVSTKPTGSSATPAPPTASTTSFTPDATGAYTLRFCATDDETDTACCTVVVNAGSSCTAPTVPTVSTCGTSWDRRPIVEFTPVPSGMTYEIWRSGDSSPLGTTSLVGQNYFRPASAIDAGLPVPGKNVDLYVKACKTSDPTCCATSATTTSKLVESCTTPVAASSSNVLFSEYIIDGDGGACSGPACEAGESIEITNLSHCPVTLSGTHFGYATSSGGTFRYMDFGAAEVVPPRGVYVAVRNRAASTCPFPFLTAEDSGLFGLKISALAMQGMGLDNGWFGNSGTGGKLRLATGAWPGNMTAGTTIALVTPYKTSAECSGTGFDAINSCGELAAGSTVSTSLTPNQMGRLWHPCDAVVGPVPSSCK